jgi:hypothetical protein
VRQVPVAQLPATTAVRHSVRPRMLRAMRIRHASRAWLLRRRHARTPMLPSGHWSSASAAARRPAERTSAPRSVLRSPRRPAVAAGRRRALRPSARRRTPPAAPTLAAWRAVTLPGRMPSAVRVRVEAQRAWRSRPSRRASARTPRPDVRRSARRRRKPRTSVPE